jgi:hypothetical protein
MECQQPSENYQEQNNLGSHVKDDQAHTKKLGLLCIDDAGAIFDRIYDYLLEDIKHPHIREELKAILPPLNLIFKSADTLLDVAKLAEQPTFDHAKKVVIDLNQLAGSYYGTNIHSMAIITANVLEGDYTQALSSTCYMFVPTAIAYTGIPYIGLAYAAAITTYSGYQFVNNFYSFFNNFNSDENQQKSKEAYRASCKTPIMLNNLLFYTRNLVIL